MNKLSKENIFYGLLILGVCALRLAVYLFDRSLIIDEANLARNIIEKDFIAFFSSLDYEQYAPPLFLCLEKLITQIFGISSLSLRFIPSLASVLSIILFYKISEKYIPSRFLFFPIIIFSVGLLFSRYGTELKQYSTDILILLSFLYAHIHYPINFRNKKNFIKWLVFGTILIWASMPLIFILAAIGFTTLILHRNQLKSDLWYYVLLLVFWLGSFAIYYFKILQYDASQELLIEFHKNYFLSIIDWKSNFYIFQNLLNKIFGFTIVVQIFIWAGLIFSFPKIKKHPRLSLFIVLLFLFTFIASFIEKFTLIPRVSLFLAPCLILIVGMGCQEIFERLLRIKFITANSNKTQLAILPIYLLMFLCIINLPKIGPQQTDIEFENAKAVINYIEKDLANEKIIIDHLAYPSYYFYSQLIDNKLGEALNNLEIREWDQALNNMLDVDQNQEYYFWYTTIDAQRLSNLLAPVRAHYTITPVQHFTNAHLLKFKRNN